MTPAAMLNNDDGFTPWENLLLPWKFILQFAGYGHFGTANRSAKLTVTSSSYRVQWIWRIWSIWLITNSILNAIRFAAESLYRVSGITSSTEDILITIATFQGQAAMVFSVIYLVARYNASATLFSKVLVTNQVFLFNADRRILIWLVLAMTVYNVVFNIGYGWDLFGRSVSKDVYKYIICDYLHGCPNGSLAIYALNRFGLFALACRLLSIFAEKIVQSLFVVICFVHGMIFKNLTSELKIRCIEANNQDTGTMKRLIYHKMAQHLQLEEDLRKLDGILSIVMLMRYSSDILALLTIKKRLLSPTVTVTDYLQLTQVLMDITMRTGTFVYVYEKAQEIIPVLENFLLTQSEISTDLYRRITTHINRLRSTNTGISLAGVAVVNRAFIATLVGVIVTYILLMWQLDDGNPNPGNLQDLQRMLWEMLRTCQNASTV